MIRESSGWMRRASSLAMARSLPSRLLSLTTTAKLMLGPPPPGQPPSSACSSSRVVTARLLGYDESTVARVVSTLRSEMLSQLEERDDQLSRRLRARADELRAIYRPA
jgi:hypothetical protein